MDNQTIPMQNVNTSGVGGMMRNFAHIQGNLDAIAKYILYAIAALLPLWFLPIQIGTEFGREATFGILIIAAGVVWLLSVLTSGEIRFQHSILLWLGAALILIWGLSTAFSVSWSTSLIFSDAISEKISTLFLGLLLMVLLGGTLRSRGDAVMFLVILVAAGGVSALATATQLLTDTVPWRWFADFAGDKNFNVVGTMNGLMLFYSALLATAIGMIVSLKLTEWKAWIRAALYLSTALLAVSILLVNYSYSWIVLAGVAIVLFGLTFRSVRESRALLGSEARGLDWRYLFAIVLLVVSIFMYMFKPVLKQLDLPAEVSPAMKTTLNIGRAVMDEGGSRALLGSGPATFGFDWLKYKDPQVNQTVFWGVRFNQGFSWVSTAFPTVGVLGVLGIVLFFIAALFTFARAVAAKREGHDEWAALGVGPLAGLAALVVAAFLYPANFSLVILLFLLTGALSYILSDKRHEEQEKGIRAVVWDFSERHVRFDSQWAVFISSLVAIFLLSLGIAGAYFELNRVRAASSAQEGIAALNAGKLDDAVLKFREALEAEPKNINYANALVQIRIQRVSNLIQRASGGENVQVEFQQEVNSANSAIEGAIQLLPLEPNLYRTKGALYELIIPFIPGTETISLGAYRQAIAAGPLNPAAYIDFARAGLTFADNIQLRLAQVAPQDREAVVTSRETVLQEVKTVLEKAAQIKPDFAAAHFLLSQAAIRLGDLKIAIQSTENAKLTAPFDIGVAFQLGLLYYQSGNLDGAQAEFERAVSINTNYSNARYFLGLIYDRKGRKADAISEFAKIEELNPDIQEVKSILTNLRAGRGALENIVPPGTPPEKRKEPPVEGSGN